MLSAREKGGKGALRQGKLQQMGATPGEQTTTTRPASSTGENTVYSSVFICV